MKCAELLIRSLHEPSISTVTSVRFVFRSSFKWFIIPILSFSLSLFLLSWRSNCIFLSSSWRKLIFSTNLELTSAKGNKINYSNFMSWKYSCKWKKQKTKKTKETKKQFFLTNRKIDAKQLHFLNKDCQTSAVCSPSFCSFYLKCK